MTGRRFALGILLAAALGASAGACASPGAQSADAAGPGADSTAVADAGRGADSMAVPAPPAPSRTPLRDLLLADPGRGVLLSDTLLPPALLRSFFDFPEASDEGPRLHLGYGMVALPFTIVFGGRTPGGMFENPFDARAGAPGGARPVPGVPVPGARAPAGGNALWPAAQDTAFRGRFEPRYVLRPRQLHDFRLRAARDPTAADTLVNLPSRPGAVPPGDAAAGDRTDALSVFVSEHSDLGMRFRGRGELGGDWTRFRPCDSGVAFTCDPSLLPQLSPELQFGVEVGGTVSDRIHLNVDYDQAREFSGANNINIYYQGFEGEFLQRLEVGDVTFALPESRFLTQGIPAGNFGFRATAQAGPVDFQTVWAQQSGDLSTRSFQLAGTGDARAFVQEDTLVLDDADYVRGQFFFLTDPREIAGYPHIDVLSLSAADLPASLAPGALPVQLYRFEADPLMRQQVEGYIQADAVAERDGETLREAGWFRYLQEGVDYVLHPSGLWVVLRIPMRPNEVLAATYVTAAGDTIGDYTPERIYNAGGRPTLRMLRASGPNHQPGRPTWDLEMHQVYRISGSHEVEESSVDLSISLGEASAGRTFKRGPTGEEISFLRLFGLDEHAPRDRVDVPAVYKPGESFFDEQPAVSGTFIVFPTLRPFQLPPPVPSENLTAEQALAVLGSDANSRIYEAGDPFERINGGLFRLTIPFRIRSDGAISSFSLGAFGIRDGSERIYLGNRLLHANQDYVVDYDVGMVTLLDPELLLGTATDTEIRANFEQKAIFQVAPTSVFGLNAHYGLGERGGVNVIGLYQSERTVVRRPQLGVEPGSIMLGGVNGELRFDAGWMDRALARVPGLSGSGSSSLTVGGEMALSLPNPNTQRDVFLDDFDGTADLPIPIRSANWQLGSAPTFMDGADGVLPAVLDETTLANLVWQHTWVEEGFGGDSLGIFEGFFPQQEIDRQINIAGSGFREPGLLMTFGRQPGEAHRWRSVTTVLSPSGTDLTKTEFLDFYVAEGDSLSLVLDLGRVSEDAFFVDPQGMTSGVRPDGEPWGLGILDQEADPMRGEIWNDDADAVGLWGGTCVAERSRVYRVGDSRANCTRSNGRRDTEDLNGNGVLDTEERYMRYVVRLDGSSPYLVRDRNETGTAFRLYRIPLRGPDAVNVGGLFSEGDWRGVQHLRVTLTGNRRGSLTLARMRLVGSRWVKRAQEGVIRGIAGDTVALGGQVEVTPVSVLTEGAAYQAPPGVLEELDDPTSAFSGRGVEFNEKSLGIRYRDIGPDERVEIYNRFQQPRNFLTYRQARLWVVPRAGDWGPGAPLSFFMKVGTDPENFYLFRTRREAAASPDAVSATDWLPEVVVDFEEWLVLRSRAEQRILENPPGPADGPVVEWSADSTYAVVMKDRARAPNLAAVRELSLGVWNEGDFATTGELWVNELRLGAAVRNAGAATSVHVDFAAGDFAYTRVSWSDRGAYFRQLEGEPSYQDDRGLDVSSTLQLGRFAPEEWGVEIPLNVQVSRAREDPTFLSRSDVRGDQLTGLRETASRRTSIQLGFRKRTPMADPRLGFVLDGLDARIGYARTGATTVTTESAFDHIDARIGVYRSPGRRDVGAVPAFLHPVADFLLGDTRLRWSPERLSFGTTWFHQESRIARYDEILVLPGAGPAPFSHAPREGLENQAQIGFRPFDAVTGSLSFTSSRDLLDPSRTIADAALHPLLRAERLRLGGVDVGWETNRRIQTRLGYRPDLAEWLRTDFTMTTIYGSDRNVGFVQWTEGAGGVPELQRNASGQRDVRASVSLDPGGIAGSMLGEEAAEEEGAWRRSVRIVAGAFDPLNATWTDGVVSRFNREAFDPGGAFQLGWGSLDPAGFVLPGSAAVLTDRTSVAAGSGVRLPLRMHVNVDYAWMETLTLDQRSDRATTNELWPNVRAGFTDFPLPTFIRPVLDRLSLSSGYQRTVQETGFGGGVQRRYREDIRVPFDFALRWTAGLTIAYRGFVGTGRGTDPTGDTERDQLTQTVSLSASFLPPDLAERLDRPLTLSVQFGYAEQTDCRINVGRQSCVPFVDQVNRSLALNLDTSVSQLEVGLQTSYTDRRSMVGQRPGSTQFQLGLWGQFLFSAGELPR
ncbi:MAG: hypothetical protein WDZ89_04200 [Gemmatimonadota bacterium]